MHKILSLVLRDVRVSFEDLLWFRTSVSEADFLFGSEITEYIDGIYRRGIKLEYWNKKYRDYTQSKPDGYDHQKVSDCIHNELTWLTAQFEPAKIKFKKYLDISNNFIAYITAPATAPVMI